jgi:hypothetical protein
VLFGKDDVRFSGQPCTLYSLSFKLVPYDLHVRTRVYKLSPPIPILPSFPYHTRYTFSSLFQKCRRRLLMRRVLFSPPYKKTTQPKAVDILLPPAYGSPSTLLSLLSLQPHSILRVSKLLNSSFHGVWSSVFFQNSPGRAIDSPWSRSVKKKQLSKADV